MKNNSPLLFKISKSRTMLWRRTGASLALSAAFAFALQPTLLVAQTQVVDPDQPVKAQPTAPAKVKKSRHTPTDFASEDLNRREAERAAQVVQEMTAATAAGKPAVAMPALTAPIASPVVTTAATSAPAVLPSAPPTEPPTQAAIPPRAPIAVASLTPDPGMATATPSPVPVTSGSAIPTQAAPVVPAPSAPPPQIAQAPPPSAPVPVRPPAAGGAPPATPAPPPVTTGVPTRSFAQSQLVPTQQPTLALEVNKGTAIKLPGPAATVFVAAPDIADVQVKSPTMIYVFAKKPGDTVLYAVDDQDRVLLNTIVAVSSPVSRMKAALDALHPGNSVAFDNQGETIVLSGVARSAVIAEDARKLALQHVGNSPAKVVNNIRINAPNQVQLRVKVAEVTRGALKRVGINWQNINSIALFGLGPATSGFATNTITATGGNLIGSARIVGTSNDGSLTSLIDLLATQSQATVLAEPNLIAMSGESASFLAGGEIPVIQPQAGGAGGVGSITVVYKQIGISLAFTPTIIGDRINLKVAPEVSQVTTNGQVSVAISTTASVIIPAIETRRASTTVELGSGQSFAIAGLLNHTTQQDIQKVPWLGDVPILGSLFKSDAYQRNETELVIIVTPYFVEPVSSQLRTPLSGRVPPTDADRLLYGRLDHPTPPQRLAVGQQPRNVGPTAGFKLE